MHDVCRKQATCQAGALNRWPVAGGQDAAA